MKSLPYIVSITGQPVPGAESRIATFPGSISPFKRRMIGVASGSPTVSVPWRYSNPCAVPRSIIPISTSYSEMASLGQTR